MKFYPADWRADPMLRNCSLTSRGLWMEMLALMHESERYGYLLVNGKQPTDRQLAIQAGATIDEVSMSLTELESEGVFSRDRNGIIYSRRMIRDEKRAENARKVGKKGGNPKLSKQTDNSAQDNQQDKPEDNGGVKAHMPEARDQKVDNTQPSVKRAREKALPDDVRKIMEEGGFVSPPPDIGLLREWYADAKERFDQDPERTLQDDILPIVRSVSAGLSKAPFKFAVFDRPLREKFDKDEAEIERLRRSTLHYTDPQNAGFRV
jgi:hypothetical protein